VNTFVALDRDVRYTRAVPTATPRIGVSVITVVYMTGPVLFEHLDSVLTDLDVDELVVVNNVSTPEDARRLQAIAGREPRMHLIEGHGNVGFAKACNMAVEAAHGRWLLFLNPDALLRPGTIRALARARAERTETPVVVGARVLNPDGTEQRGGRRGEVTPVSTFMTLSHLAEKPQFADYEIHREHEPAPSEPVEIPTISGACFLMTRADYDAVGGFDTGYFLHVEDVDLCWRVRRQGGVVLYHPGAEVTHFGSTSVTDPMFVEFWKGRGLARYFRKRADTLGGKALAWLLGPPIVAAAVARAVKLKLRG
jgi:hypothetical protein